MCVNGVSMARRGGFLSAMNKLAREMERSGREAARAAKRAENERARQVRQERINRLFDERESKRLYAEERMEETAELNQELAETLQELESILTSSLDRQLKFDFSHFLSRPVIPQLKLGTLSEPFNPPDRKRYIAPKPAWYKAWIPFVAKAYKEAQAALDRNFAGATDDYRTAELARLKRVKELTAEHASQVAKIQQEAEEHNQQVMKLEASFKSGAPVAVAEFFSGALAASPYPDGFPQKADAVYSADSRQLVLEYDIPSCDDIIPKAKEYKYVKARDAITETKLAETHRKALYTSTVAQTVLRCIHEVFALDADRLVDTVVFSAYVETIHPGTGQDIRLCLVSLRTTRDSFSSINLRKADPLACLQSLNAAVSKSPAELAPVRPILELNMHDPRFITESDVLSELDSRPNLMDLSPGEFESLITNLFQKMGLDTKLTQASRDGGVDCVAFDPRPIFGGKVVIQAKRYKNTVGVSAVRDLFGTVQNEGASKGILVATSGYGKAAFDFANGKPIELLDGGNLLYLLKEHAGVDARIVMPE